MCVRNSTASRLQFRNYRGELDGLRPGAEYDKNIHHFGTAADSGTAADAPGPNRAAASIRSQCS